MVFSNEPFSQFKSVKTKMLFSVMTVSTILTSLVIFLNFYFEYNDDLNSLEERVAQIEKTTVPTLSNAIWNLDEQYLKIQLDGILKIQDIVLTRVLDNHGNLIIEKGGNIQNNDEIIKREFYLYSDHSFSREYLGKLQLFITKDYIVEKIKKKIFLFMTSQFVKTFLLAWLILLIFHYFITRNISQIIAFTKNFDLDARFLNRLQINRPKHDPDELDILEFEINRMLEKIYVLNQQKDRTISEQHKELQIQKAMEINSARLTSINDMLSGMSHEINNPMTVIGFSAKKIQECLKDEKLDVEKIHFFSKRIQESTARVKNILHSVQVTSRVSDDEPFEVTSVQDLITGVIEALNAETSIFNIQFVLEYENETTKNSLIKIKRVALYQTLQNLVKNAAEAVKNQVNPIVKLNMSISNGRLLIKVIDSGPGIPLHLQDKIFHPFYTTKEVGKGTGLGLTIASRLAEINLGKLTLDDNEKQTTFVLNLPLFQ